MARPATRAVVVVVLLASALAACSGTPGKRTARPTPVTLKSQALKATKVVDLGGGARVVFADAPVSGSTLQVSTSNPPPDPAEWNSLATPVHLEVQNGSLGPGATLEFPIPAGVPQDATTVGIATWDPATASWTPVNATIDRARGVVTTFTTHFSWWQPFSWDWAGIAAGTNQLIGQLVGKRASGPSCDPRRPAPAWVSMTAGIDNASGLAVRACTQSQGNVLDVELVNNRPYGMMLTYGSGVQWGWHSGGSSVQDAAISAVADRLVRPNELYLPPLGSASVGIAPQPAGSKRDFHIGIDGRTVVLDTISAIAGPAIAKIGGKLGVPLLAECGTYFTGVTKPRWSSAADVKASIADSAGCVQTAFVKAAAAGLLDSHEAQKLGATLQALKKANAIGAVLTAYDVEWKLLDLWVDSGLAPGPDGIGHGFSVLTHTDSGAPPSPQPAPSSQAAGPPQPPMVVAPPPPPAGGSLTVSLSNGGLFLCDGTSHSLGTLSGARSGEVVSFVSPTERGLLSGTASGAGTVPLRWQCTPGQGGTRWDVTARGTSSGRTATFTVTGQDPASAAPQPPPPTPPPPPAPAPNWTETTGGTARTHSNPANAGGYEGPTIPAYAGVQIACKLTGFKVADGNPWWYLVASSPWNSQCYVSADAFYNNGATSGSLHGTPWVDSAVQNC